MSSTRRRKGDVTNGESLNKSFVKDADKSVGSKTKTPFAGRFNPKLGRNPSSDSSSTSICSETALPHQTWARIVMFASIVIIAYYGGGGNLIFKGGLASMAKQSEIIEDKRFQNLVCAPSFKKDIVHDLKNEKCFPSKCGRVVFDNIVNEQDAHGLLELAKKGLAMGGSSGGASILDLHSGALSKGEQFVSIYKAHPDVFVRQDFDLYRKVMLNVKRALASHFQISPDHLYLSHPTFFSRITSEPAKTLHDEYWHVHIDKDTYPNFHYTSLLYLTDFNHDFKGGQFVFVDSDDKLNRTIEPRLGRVSAFTSGIENKHHVEPVTEGTRYALTMGFTCDKTKEIADPGGHVMTSE